MEIKKLKTDNKDLLFVGYDGFEEFYQNTSERGGWSFMGLRPETEENLRSRRREVEPTEFFDLPDWAEHYFDYEKWADDQEGEWYEYHDVQAERLNEEGETLYLGFGTGTSVKSYFNNHNIKTYEDYTNHFDFIGLNKEEFNSFLAKYGQDL